MFKVSENHSLVNVSNSILKRFGLETYHDSYRVLDEILEANPDKRICLMLFDGLGKTILKEHRKVASYIYGNRLKTITSVFPPTTVAATTSLLTGLYPCETGWLGWRQRFLPNREYVDMFSSYDWKIGGKMETSTYDILPITTLVEHINNKYGENAATKLMSFELCREKYDNQLYFDKLQEILSHGYHFVYAYNSEPDTTLHDYGNTASETDEMIKNLNDGFKKIVENNPDVLFIGLADHGHIDIEYMNVEEHPDFYDTLKDTIFLEPRASMVDVKEGKIEEFEELFKKYYGKYFELYNKSQIKSRHIFGYSDNCCPLFDSLLGDYLMVAKNKYTFKGKFDEHDMKSTHAGGLKREGMILLSVYNND